MHLEVIDPKLLHPHVTGIQRRTGPVEFQIRGAFPPVTGYRYNEMFDVPPGTFTDDTSMTLCIAQSLVDKGFDIQDQICKYIDWYEHGYMSGMCSWT